MASNLVYLMLLQLADILKADKLIRQRKQLEGEKKFSHYEIMLFQALFGLLQGGEKVHTNAAGLNSWGAYKRRVKTLISHVRWDG